MSGRKTEQLEELAAPSPVEAAVVIIDEEHEHTDDELAQALAGPGIPAPPGFTRMTHPDLGATADVPDPAVPLHRSRGWETQPDPTDPPSGDNPTTPED